MLFIFLLLYFHLSGFRESEHVFMFGGHLRFLCELPVHALCPFFF